MKIFGLGVLLLNLMVQNYPVVAYEPESLSIYKTIAAHESSALEAAYRAVKNKLASKVFLMPNTSVIWGARLPQDDEVLMLTIGKTTQLNDIMNVIDYKRPFTGFEVVASRISDGCLPYLDWATTYASGNITAATLTDEERKLESEFAAQVMSQKYENTSLVDTTEPKIPQDEIKVAEENKDEEDKEDDDEEEDEAAQKEKEDEERGITEADDEYEDEQEEEEEAEREKEEEKRQAQSRTKMQANDQRERNYADYYEQDGMQDIKRRAPYRAQGQRRPRDPNRAKMPDNEVNYANPPYDDYAEAPPAGVRESNRARGQRRQRGPNGYRMPNNQYDDAPLYDDYIAAAGVTPIRRGYRRRPTATAGFRTAIVQEMAPTKHQLNENDVVIDVHSVQTVEEDPVAEMKKAEATTIAKATKRAKGVTKEKKVAKKATATKVAKAKAPRKTMAKSKSRKARVTIERPQAYAKNYRTLPSGDGLYVAKRRLRTIARPAKSRMYARQRALIPVQPSNSRSFALLRAQPSNSRNPPLVFHQPSNLRIFPMFRSQQRPRKFAILRAQPAYPRNFPVARVMPANPPNFAVVRSQPIRSRNFPVARARIANSRNFQRPNYRNVPALPALPAMQPRWPVLSDLRAR